MLRPGIWMVLILLAQGFAVHCAAKELDLPSIEANGKTYSNVTVSSTSRNRVVVRHTAGLVTIHADDLNAQTRQQLLDAGVIREAVPSSSSGWGKGFTKKSGDNSNDSFASQIGSRFESEALSRSGVSPEKFISALSVGIILGVCGLIFGLYLLRCWCLFRICKKGRGNGSLLVFLPLLRWLPLADAARMKRALLWIPTFALIGLYLPPPMPQVQGFTFGYTLVVGLLWLTTAFLFAIWCIKICKQLECSPWFGLLLILPVLDWVALLYLAFSEGKPEPIKAGPNRIVLAI